MAGLAVVIVMMVLVSPKEAEGNLKEDEWRYCALVEGCLIWAWVYVRVLVDHQKVWVGQVKEEYMVSGVMVCVDKGCLVRVQAAVEVQVEGPVNVIMEVREAVLLAREQQQPAIGRGKTSVEVRFVLVSFRR